MSHARTPLALSIAFALLVLPAQAVRGDASAAATELDRIVVTAQKREQQVQEVPIAITALSGEFLDRLNISGFADINGYVPGLQTQVQSPNNPGFVIRGITSDDGGANQEARVSVFQDGVSISRSRGAYVELHDMERIEVVKGPQTTLFGRGLAYGIPGEQVDGMDVLAVKAAGEKAVAHCRAGNGPYILEMMTYRYRGHSMSDPAKYRTREEVEKIKTEKDCIEHVRDLLTQGGLASDEELKAIDKEIKAIVNESAEFAKESPEPDLSELWTDITV